MNGTDRISAKDARKILAEQQQIRSKRSLRFTQDDFKVLQAKKHINAGVNVEIKQPENEQTEKTTSSRKSKYNNKKIDDFDSLREKKFYDELLLLQTAQDDDVRVIDIQRQVKFELIPEQYDENGNIIEKSCSYIADFVVTRASGKVEVFDVKGVRTSTYIIKRKLMLFLKGIQIIEV